MRAIGLVLLRQTPASLMVSSVNLRRPVAPSTSAAEQPLSIEASRILARVTSRPSPLNQANFFNCTVSAEQLVPAAGGGD